MREPKNIEWHDVNQVLDLATAVDTGELPQDYALEINGFRNTIQGVIGERDFGTNRFIAGMPTLPAALSVRGSARFYNKDTDTDYDLVWGEDGTNFRIYIRDVSAETDGEPSNIKAATDNGWCELTAACTAVIFGTPSGKTIGLTSVLDAKGAALTLGTNSLRGWICVNTTKSPFQVQYVASSVGDASPAVTVLGSVDKTGYTWSDTDQLLFFKHWGMFRHCRDSITSSVLQASKNIVTSGNGHNITTKTIVGLNKMRICYWLHDAWSTLYNPFLLQRINEPLFKQAGGTSLLHLINSYFLTKQDLMPSYQDAGTLGGTTATRYYYINTAGALTSDYIQAFMMLRFLDGTYDMGADYPQSRSVGVLVTLIYNGYQESDPVLRFIVAPASSDMHDAAASVLTAVRINPATMPPGLTGIRVYGRNATSGDDVDSEYYLSCEIDFRSASPNLVQAQNGAKWAVSWEVDTPVAGYYHFNFFPIVTYQITNPSTGTPATFSWTLNALGADSDKERGSYSLQSSLQHATDLTRSTIKSRFTAQVARGQESVVVTDDGENSVRLSSYDGYAAHQDDNFPDVSADLRGNPLKIFLSGEGRMFQIMPSRGNAVVFRAKSLEIVDPSSGQVQYVPADVEAWRSIVPFPGGIAWWGRYGVWALPEGGGEPVLLNPSWTNLHDGTLIATGSTPYVTDADRKNVIGGYDDQFQELWFHVKVTKEDTSVQYMNFRYSFPRKRWFQRVVSNSDTDDGRIRSFCAGIASKRFIIAHKDALLYYQSTDATYPYLDDVTAASTGGEGIFAKILLNVGSLYAIASSAVIYGLRLEFRATTVTGATDYFEVKLFPQEYTSALATLQFIADTTSVFGIQARMVPAFGQIDKLKVEISIPSAMRSNFKKLVLSRASFGVVRQPRIGNN